MKNIIMFILFNISFSFSLYAQVTEEIRDNPFSNGRVNYFKRTAIVFNEYLDTHSGSVNTTDLRLIVPIGSKSWNVRADLPIVSKTIDGASTTGLGDFSFGAAYIPYIDTKRGIALRLRIVTNSANDPLLGSGKWVAVPALFYAQYIGSKRHYLWLSTIENFSSFAGSNNRSDINITVYENLVFRYFGKNWIGADVAFRYNTGVDGFQNNAFLEYGRKITPNNMLYIHPSVAFGGQKAYNYGFEAGVLILF